MAKNNIADIAQIMLNQKDVAEHPLVVSCDAHGESTYVFAVDIRTGEIRMDRNIIGGTTKVAKVVMKIGNRRDTIVLYEAGPLGYSLYRKLDDQHYACKIIAPNSIPHRNGKKTDRQDAIGNFNYYCSGLLRFISVPEPIVESARECLRYRFNLVWERSTEKQRFKLCLNEMEQFLPVLKAPGQ